MRFRPVRSVLLAAVALSWVACQDTVPQDSPLGLEPSFAARGPADKACDTKGLPVRDYFLSRADATLVKNQLRDLTAACKDGPGDTALQLGFAILSGVENARDNGNVGAPSDGAQIVVDVWNVMTWGEGAFFACGEKCTIPVLDVALIERSLDADGGFGVRGPAGNAPVISMGDPVWGIEPDATCADSVCDWGEVLPDVYANGDATALIFGYLGDIPAGLADTPLPGTEFGFDWSVAPWHALTTGINPLAIGVCSSALTAGNQERVSHGSSILQLAREPSYCSAAFAASQSSRLLKLASAIVPMWPQPLYAALAGVSGSGKARDFSLFNGYEIAPVGVIQFLTQPGDALAYPTGERPRAGQYICALGSVPPTDDGCGLDGGIRVALTTAAGSSLDANERVTLSINALDNNGSWTLYPDEPLGEKVNSESAGLMYEWTDLALDKPGRYLLCVSGMDGAENTTGLEFPETCSEAFHIYP